MWPRLLCGSLLWLAVLGGSRSRATGVSPDEAKIIQAIDDDPGRAGALLEKLVDTNSGTFNPAGVTAVGKLLEPELQALGFTTRFIPMDAVKRGPHLVGERKGNRGKRILLIGHMDTVFEPSSPFQKFGRNGDRATGPGSCDMKGGIVVLLSALESLKRAG